MIQRLIKTAWSNLTRCFKQLYNHFKGHNRRILALDLSIDELHDLLVNKQVNPNHSTMSGFTPIHLAGINPTVDEYGYDCYPDKIELLLEHGANPNAQTSEEHFSDTPLQLLIRKKLKPLARIFIAQCKYQETKIDYSLTDTNGCTPFNLACKSGQTKLALEILEAMGKFHPSLRSPDNDGMTPMNYAILLEQEKLFIELHKLGESFTPNNQTDTFKASLFISKCLQNQANVRTTKPLQSEKKAVTPQYHDIFQQPPQNNRNISKKGVQKRVNFNLDFRKPGTGYK